MALLAVLSGALAIMAAACSSDAGLDTAARDRCEERWGVGNCVERDDKWVPLAAATSTTTTAASTSTTALRNTVTAAPTTTTTTTEPAVPPIDQLAGLRPYYEDEVCRAALAVLNSPSLSEEVKTAIGFGITDRVAESGVIAIHGAIDSDSFGSQYDSYYYLSPVAESKVSMEDFYARNNSVSPSLGESAPYAEMTRGPDGRFGCEPYNAIEGGGM
jgi:hypothetical protein